MSDYRVVDNLEYYMDELIDSFEDFVKKSLVLVTVALASVVIMAMYVMNQMAQQNRCSSATIRGSPRIGMSISSMPSSYSNTSLNRKDEYDHRNQPSSQPLKASASRKSSEKVIREIGFGNYPEPPVTNKSTEQMLICSKSRTVISSQVIPSSISKRHISESQHSTKNVEVPRTSCCSKCCVNEDNR